MALTPETNSALGSKSSQSKMQALDCSLGLFTRA